MWAHVLITSQSHHIGYQYFTLRIFWGNTNTPIILGYQFETHVPDIDTWTREFFSSHYSNRGMHLLALKVYDEPELLAHCKEMVFSETLNQLES